VGQTPPAGRQKQERKASSFGWRLFVSSPITNEQPRHSVKVDKA
jgi:hypothetical protein